MQAASVLGSISPKATKLSLVPPVDLLGLSEPFPLGLGDLFQSSHMLGITPRLVPLMNLPRPQCCRHHVRQR